MRYVIKETSDRGEMNRYVRSSIMPIIGHVVGHGSRRYEIMDIEFAAALSRDAAQDVRVLVRRLS